MLRPRRAISLLAAVSAAIFMSASAVLSLNTEQEDLPMPVSADAPAEYCLYTVGELNGMIAVFSGADGSLLRLTDFPVSSLPSADRTALGLGIPIDSDEELAMLLEDYQ